MLAFCTGQVGLEKRRFLEEIAALATSRGFPTSVINIGKLMYELEPHKIPEGKILSLDLHHLDLLARVAYREALARAAKSENAIINAHATFRWRFGLFRAFDIKLLQEFRPNLLVTAIDNCETVKANLLRHQDTVGQSLTLKDILVWREEEMMATDIFSEALTAMGAPVPHFVAAMNLGSETWFDLLFTKRARAYASFPITGIIGNAAVLREKDAFVATLKKYFTVFDPYSISDRKLIYEGDRASADRRNSVAVEVRDGHLEIALIEIEEARADIDRQIIARDFKLIDQADMVVSFIPVVDGRLEISSGVERELQHGFETGKDTYIFCPAPEKLSPFAKEPATQIFRTAEEFASWAEAAGGMKAGVVGCKAL